jgi:F0F1-type ATP synthase assembly protein I
MKIKIKIILTIFIILVALVAMKYVFIVALLTLKIVGAIVLAFLSGYLFCYFSKSKNSQK